MINCCALPLQFIDLCLNLVKNMFQLKRSDISFRIMIISLLKYIVLCSVALKIKTQIWANVTDFSFS